MFNLKDFLTESKMGKLVARLLGKTDLPIGDNGAVSLTDEERELIRSNYGDAFLAKLEGMSFADSASIESTHELFDAAVAYHVEQSKAPLLQRIQSLQETITTLADESEPAPKTTPTSPMTGVAGATPMTFQIDMRAKHNALVSSILSSGNSVQFSALENGTIDISELNKEFDMTMPPNVRLELLTKRLYLGFKDSRYMTRVQSNTDYIASDAIITEVSQEFTPKWTPKGTMKFTPIRIPYRRHKINVSILPADVIKSWLLFMWEQGKTMQEMPITKYIIENHIIPKVLDDITRSMIGKGKYEAAPADVRTGDEGRPAAKSMDGFETILVEGKKTGEHKINYFKDAKDPFTLKGQELLDYVDSFVDAINDFFVGPLEIHCSEQFLTHYQREDFAVNGKYTGQSIGDKVRFTKFTFAPMESMYNSPILFATTKNNFIELVDYSKAQNCINKLEEVDYEVKIFGEYSLSTGFKIGEAVYASVPEGYDPSATVILDSPAVDTEDSKWTYGGAEADSTTGEDDLEGA